MKVGSHLDFAAVLGAAAATDATWIPHPDIPQALTRRVKVQGGHVRLIIVPDEKSPGRWRAIRGDFADRWSMYGRIADVLLDGGEHDTLADKRSPGRRKRPSYATRTDAERALLAFLVRAYGVQLPPAGQLGALGAVQRHVEPPGCRKWKIGDRVYFRGITDLQLRGTIYATRLGMSDCDVEVQWDIGVTRPPGSAYRKDDGRLYSVVTPGVLGRSTSTR